MLFFCCSLIKKILFNAVIRYKKIANDNLEEIILEMSTIILKSFC